MILVCYLWDHVKLVGTQFQPFMQNIMNSWTW